MFKSIKRLKVLLAVLVIATSAWAQGNIWNGTADTDWYGDGSETEFTITTAEQLAGLAQLVNGGTNMSGKTITLGNDIMLNNTANWQNWATTAPTNTWTAIGTDAAFAGTFDGAGHVVSGVYINATTDYQGLFGYVSGGAIKNLGAVASYVKGGQYVGGLVGVGGNGPITNSYATGNVTGTGDNVGGLVGGGGNGPITNSYATGNVTGTNNVGGLVGTSGYITNSYATGNVTGTNNVGGLVGNCNGRGIYSSYATGNVTGTNYVGGLVGINQYEIGASYSTGNVMGTGSYVGGLVGRNYGGGVTNCYYDSQTSGRSDDDGRGTPKTTAEMKEQTTYSDWNFAAIWGIDGNINGGYPHHDIVVTVNWADCRVSSYVVYKETKPLSITIEPDNATNKTVACSVVSGGATISGNNITFTQAGQVTIRATIANGCGRGCDFMSDFNIEVAKAPGVFVTPPALNTTYTPMLTLADVTPPANYEWNDPTTPLWIGNNQIHALYTDPSGNYYDAFGQLTVNVAKAPAPTGVPRTETVAAGYAHTYHFDLKMLLPDIADLWPETYHPVITNNTSGVLGALSYTGGNILEIPVNNVSGAGLSATITVTVSNYSYEDFTAVITVTIADPTPILPSQLASGNKAVQMHNGISLTAASNATVEIYNLSGNLVSRQNFASGVYAISLGHLPKGVYLAKVSFGSGKEVLRVPVR